MRTILFDLKIILPCIFEQQGKENIFKKSKEKLSCFGVYTIKGRRMKL
jgi:hypothetical protein